MQIDLPTPLLAGLSPAQFMRKHWQKKPLLVRQAFNPVQPPASLKELAALAARDDVESRLVTAFDGDWKLKQGPIARLPAMSKPGWTLLVQGLDQHLAEARAMLDLFRFIPDARLDDLMLSVASDGGGVGPHFDSYDVFLIQLAGQRCWRIGAQRDAALRDDVPLKIIANFVPEEEFVLDAGDMLYLPPGWAHDGVAVGGGCITGSVGFRASTGVGLAAELLPRLLDDIESAGKLYTDPRQEAVTEPARVPAALLDFARRAVEAAVQKPLALERALGEALTEPKANVWFEPGDQLPPGLGCALDRRSRMLYDESQVFLNGESFRAGGRDAVLMRRLADCRALTAAEVGRLSAEARELLDQWTEDGWVQPLAS
ncbi:JmjC domain-containing protein [Roseateles asaccharophilus]|uniref:50S ribosomal protein L16 3-hydroxylase n=1 Tax=Roseateles asaccharophilus TaxID=582607 RepID=A0ABU2AA70_9BURK|nr:cupin domain-containing protein [Roseateles asaccharophilus]MDR7334101.1 50S ribosomal protein L16 3-hydroxylase [Roseateles asaccharophilus]